jgi:dihydrofolate reductase
MTSGLARQPAKGAEIWITCGNSCAGNTTTARLLAQRLPPAAHIGEEVATALDVAGGKNLEILGADVAGQCLQRGLVDEILVYVLPVLLGDGIPFSSPGLARIDLEPLSSTRSAAATILRFRVRRYARRSRPSDKQDPGEVYTL